VTSADITRTVCVWIADVEIRCDEESKQEHSQLTAFMSQSMIHLHFERCCCSPTEEKHVPNLRNSWSNHRLTTTGTIRKVFKMRGANPRVWFKCVIYLFQTKFATLIFCPNIFFLIWYMKHVSVEPLFLEIIAYS
jgi:hypothetical protein